MGKSCLFFNALRMMYWKNSKSFRQRKWIKAFKNKYSNLLLYYVLWVIITKYRWHGIFWCHWNQDFMIYEVMVVTISFFKGKSLSEIWVVFLAGLANMICCCCFWKQFQLKYTYVISEQKMFKIMKHVYTQVGIGNRCKYFLSSVDCC